MRALLKRWDWWRTRKLRNKTVRKAHDLGYVHGDINYWLSDSASPEEWTHFFEVVNAEIDKDLA